MTKKDSGCGGKYNKEGQKERRERGLEIKKMEESDGERREDAEERTEGEREERRGEERS